MPAALTGAPALTTAEDAAEEERELVSERCRQRLFELTGRFHAGTLVTRASDGSLRARPMTLALLDAASDELGFLTLREAEAVHEIESEPIVSVVFQDARHHVAWSGRAYVDRERYRIARAWQPELSRWFPEGPEDPHVVLLVVRAIRAEYWSASVVTGALRALGVAAGGTTMREHEDAPKRHGVVVFGDDGALTEW